MAGSRTLRLGAKTYPVILPSLGDPRLQLAAVIISIHVLGQTALGFRVSVPQILVAILTCAVIEVAWTFNRRRQIVWPASAMLTGSGVALILRLVGMERGDHWSWRGWHLFALVAGFSLLTKYLIRYRGTHLFNPSNLGLVAAFLVMGSAMVEPLDFWWAPLGFWMAFAYLIILFGGLVITARLRLLALGLVFWLTLAAGLGLVSASGHCMTAAWALQPVCGPQFWWVVITSPEVLVFLFFMITDPKTIPEGRSARIVFGVCLALVCTLLIAPQTTEFGAKVGLLAGLVIMTPLRFVFDRLLPETATGEGRLRITVRVVSASAGSLRIFARGAAAGSLVVLVALGIVAAGAPARETVQAAPDLAPSPVDVEIDSSGLPPVTVGADARALNSEVADAPGPLALALAQNLAIEGAAMRGLDTSLLRAADDVERLIEMERKIEAAATAERLVVSNYTFETLDLDVMFTDGPQGGASLGLEATGVVEEIIYDLDGVELGRSTSPFATTFVLRQGAGERWLIVREVIE